MHVTCTLWAQKTVPLTKLQIHVISVHKHATVQYLFLAQSHLEYDKNWSKQCRGDFYFDTGMFSIINRLKTAKLQISGKEFSFYIFYCRNVTMFCLNTDTCIHIVGRNVAVLRSIAVHPHSCNSQQIINSRSIILPQCNGKKHNNSGQEVWGWWVEGGDRWASK